jgi:hypothetical protein
MSKRDKAKSAAVKAANKRAEQLVLDAMQRKNMSYPELSALTNIDADNIQSAVSNSVGGLSKMLFELGYELALTVVPLNRQRLEELAQAR